MPVEKELKTRLSVLKRSRRFVRWDESAGLARELRALLQQIEDQVEDAQAGCTLVANFYTTDQSVFGRCDDSSGHVGDVYRYVDIARIYLECGEEQTALDWLERIPTGESFQQEQRDELLLTIYGKQGNQQQQTEVARRSFRRQRGKIGFERWISIVGEDQRNELLNQEVLIILDAPLLSLTDAAFLVEMEQWDAAESYLQVRAEQLNGDHYQFLLPLAETFASLVRPLTASLLYRALLDSILRRARTTTYGHGARYLRKLDLLTKTVSDWGDVESHRVYVEQLRHKHGRKTSFWSRYER